MHYVPRLPPAHPNASESEQCYKLYDQRQLISPVDATNWILILCMMFNTGVTRKFSREGHNFLPKKFSRFCTKVKNGIFVNLRIFGTKLDALSTIKKKKIVDFSRDGKK